MTWHRGGRTYKLRETRAARARWVELNATDPLLYWRKPKCKPADCKHGLSHGVQALNGDWSYWCDDCGAELPKPEQPRYWGKEDE